MKKKNLLTRVIIIVVVTVVGLYLVIGPRRRPTAQDFTWSGIKQSLRSNIRLGLDLQGGSHLVMRVKTEEFLKRLTEDNHTAAQNAAKDAGYRIKGGRADTGAGNYRVVLEPTDASKAAEIKDAVEKKVELGDTSVWSYSQSGGNLTWTMTAAAERLLADNATTQALNIIESRINALGITEPTLQTHGAQSSHQTTFADAGCSGSGTRQGDPQGRITTRTRTRYWARKPGAADHLSDGRSSDAIAQQAGPFRRIAKSCRTVNESRIELILTIRTSQDRGNGS